LLTTTVVQSRPLAQIIDGTFSCCALLSPLAAPLDPKRHVKYSAEKKFVAAGCGRARQAFRGMAGGGIGISG